MMPEISGIKALVAQLPAAQESGNTLLDRLRAKNGRRPDISHLDDMSALLEQLAANGRADFEAFMARHPELADDDKPAPGIRRVGKQPNAATILKRLRAAGERGTVRIELPNGLVITSSMAGEPSAMPEDADAAERLWLDRVAKNAH